MHSHTERGTEISYSFGERTPGKVSVPRLACIIPVLGTTDGLETTLVSVLERRPDDCELVVVLNVPYDDPYQLSGEVKFLDAPRGAGLVKCLNLGIGATQAPIIHTLACGYEVADGWIERAQAHFGDPRVAAVTPTIHGVANRDDVISTGAGYARGGSKTILKQAAVGPLLQAAFIRREALTVFEGAIPTAVGDGLADLDLALTLRHAGWQIRFDSRCQVFAPRIDQPRIAGFSAARQAERFFWRHWSETGRVAGLAAHLLAVVANIAGSGWKAPLSALGRFVGLCELGSARSYRQTLAAAKAAAAHATAEWEWQSAESDHRELSSRGQSLRIDKPHPTARRVEAESVRGRQPKASQK